MTISSHLLRRGARISLLTLLLLGVPSPSQAQEAKS
jgi:hypothetical protein